MRRGQFDTDFDRRRAEFRVGFRLHRTQRQRDRAGMERHGANRGG